MVRPSVRGSSHSSIRPRAVHRCALLWVAVAVVRCCALLCVAVRCCWVLCVAVHCWALLGVAVRCCALLCVAVRCPLVLQGVWGAQPPGMAGGFGGRKPPNHKQK